MLNEGKSKQILLSVLGVAILVVAVVGISYAAFTSTVASTNNNSITTGTITMAYAQPNANVSLTGKVNQTAALGYANDPFTFSLTGSAQAKMIIHYTLTIVPAAGNTANFNEKVRVGLKKGSDIVTNAGFKLQPADGSNANYTDGILASALAGATTANQLYIGSMTLAGSGSSWTATDTFSVYLWVDNSATLSASTETFTMSVNVQATATPLGSINNNPA